MIILPAPWEGLHPAFPKRPDPFNTGALTNAASTGGTAGLLFAAVATLFRRSPQASLKVAAWGTLLIAGVAVPAEQFVGRAWAKPYLESKGIAVPRQKLVERTFHLDEDSFIVAGGIAGLLLARSIAKPWQVTGWKRAVGAFSMGAFLGDLANYGYHWRQITPCAQINARNKVLRNQYTEDVKQFSRNSITGKYSVSLESSGQIGGPDAAENKQPGGTTSMQQLLANLQKSAEENMEKIAAADATKLDDTDPQPHHSELRDGERVFRPDTNYTWQGTLADLDSHIKTLRERREHLKQEAELLWHKLAVREAEYHSSAATTDETAKEDARIALEVMNHLHINAYLEISQHDWMIADSQKKQLQLKTLEQSKQSPWIPAAPPNSDRLVPKHTLLLLEELERDNLVGIEELEIIKANTQVALDDPALEAIDKFTGMKVGDPWAAAKRDLDEVEKTLGELKVMKEAIERLKRELGGDR